MQVAHINPFLRSVAHTFSTMLGAQTKRGELSLGDPRKRKYPISGIIGLSGEATGMVVINLSEEVAIKAASKLLLEEQTKINDEVIDAVGELANMIAGQAKAELTEYNLSISLPSVVTGEGHEVRFPSNKPPLCVPFETDLGPLFLEVGLEPAEVCV
jgi:chemotaxis protein CheX